MDHKEQTSTEDLLKMTLLDRARTVMAENPIEGGHTAVEVMTLLQEKEAVNSMVTVLDVADELRKFFN